jgi:hypothetical protein
MNTKKRKPLKPSDYPRLIRVRNTIYHVLFVKALPKNILGMCDQENKLIYISKEQDPHEMFCTYLHEVLHAFEAEFKCVLGHPKIRKLEYFVAGIFMQLMAGMES